jgi:hypothetical protein
MFITTPEFLSGHRDHRRQIIQIISTAETLASQGWPR